MDTTWIWSDEHGDYYRYKPRERAGKSIYDLVWGRTIVEPPVASVAPIAPAASATIHQPQYMGAPSYSFYPDPSSNSNIPHAYAQSPQPVGQTTKQLPVNQHAIPVELVQRVSSPVSKYNIPKYGFVVPLEPNPGTSYSSSRSTEGPRTITPTTSAETQSPSITELAWPTNPIRIDEDASPETSVIQTGYPTPDGRYENIQKPRNYFKKGRVFKIIWLEPRGEPIASTTSSDQFISTPTHSVATIPTDGSTSASDAPFAPTPGVSTQIVHAKPRLFVVVRQKSRHCLCVPIYTYSQQATSKPGVNPEDHAPLVQEGYDVVFHPQEKQDKLKKRLLLVVEDSTIQWNHLSRINFGKVQSVEYNLKVRTIGRIAQECTADLETSFREAIGLGDE